jgi:hypothetical protein
MPTAQDYTELLSFLPRLTTPGFHPTRHWHGGWKNDRTFVLPWPEYHAVVGEFVDAASRDCWLDPDYVPEIAGRMLEDHDLVASADLAQVKTMLTYCVRGERFCSGHWEEMIEAGHIERLLRRLSELADGRARDPG